jgi:class 3 adenylate cyclase
MSTSVKPGAMANASIEHAASSPGEHRTGRHVRDFYRVRIVSSLGALGVALAYLHERGEFTGYHAFVFLLGAVYPHISYFMQMKLELGRRVEHATLVFDAFIGGSVVYFVSYSMLPTVAVLMITLINPVAYAGFTMFPFGALGVVLGLGIPTALYGGNFEPQDIFYMNVAAGAYLLSFFTLFAYAVYLRTDALQRSRREMRQQRITIEIEKKRSDSLLNSILPAPAVAEFEANGKVAPRRHEGAVLIAVALPGLARLSAEGPPEFSLAAISEVLRAIDTICGRHGLEGLSTIGHGYIAAAGLDARAPNPAVSALQAALEVRQYMHEDMVARRARAEAPLDFSILLHAGTLLTGLVEMRKSTFEIFGDALDETLSLARKAAAGEVTVSAAVAARVGEAARFASAGPLQARGRSIETLRAERPAA